MKKIFYLSKVGVSGRALEEIFLFIQSWRIGQSFGRKIFLFIQSWRVRQSFGRKIFLFIQSWRIRQSFGRKIFLFIQSWRIRQSFGGDCYSPTVGVSGRALEEIVIRPQLAYQAELWKRLLFAHSWRIR